MPVLPTITMLWRCLIQRQVAIGKLYDLEEGVLRRAWLFALVLTNSRKMVLRIVFDQRLETWLRLHADAFEELGGVPTTIVPDNLKAAVVRAAFGIDGLSALNRSYRELARHYGFKVDPTPPRAPEKKGRVERSIRYVKHNFVKTLGDVDIYRARRARALESRDRRSAHPQHDRTEARGALRGGRPARAARPSGAALPDDHLEDGEGPPWCVRIVASCTSRTKTTILAQ